MCSAGLGGKIPLPRTGGAPGRAGPIISLLRRQAVVHSGDTGDIYSIKASGLEGDPLENTQKILDGLLANM